MTTTAPPSSIPRFTLERLRKNDPSLTKLKLVQHYAEYSDDLEELLEGMRGNHIVKYVSMERQFVRDLVQDRLISVLRAVGQMTHVEEVEIWSVRLPLQEFCQAFRQSNRLVRLGFGLVTLVGDLDASALCGHVSLRDFYLSDFRLSDPETSNLDSLCHALSTCPQLEFVEIFQHQQQDLGPPFTSTGLAVLMDSPSLHHLTLRRLGLTADIAADLAQALTTNRTLRVLCLNENRLGDAGCAAVGRGLAANTSVQELDLRKNQLSSEGCPLLAQELITNTGLEKLTLAGNPIGDSGAQGLAQLLLVHPVLKTLELHRTHLTDVGCAHIVETLRKNTTLISLNMSYNQITEATYIKVADVLVVNRSLKTINLQVTRKIKAHAYQPLLGMLEENTVLESVTNLFRVPFEPQEYHEVKRVLHQVNLYLRMNHAGRRSLLQGTASLKDWARALLAVQEDLDGLYYLMRANPTIFCNSSLQDTATLVVR